MLKRMIAVAATLALAATAAVVAAESYTIGISQFAEHGSLDNCRTGFIEGLAEAGLVEGDNLTVIYQNAQADMGVAQQIAAQFAAKPVDNFTGEQGAHHAGHIADGNENTDVLRGKPARFHVQTEIKRAKRIGNAENKLKLHRDFAIPLQQLIVFNKGYFVPKPCKAHSAALLCVRRKFSQDRPQQNTFPVACSFF